MKRKRILRLPKIPSFPKIKKLNEETIIGLLIATLLFLGIIGVIFLNIYAYEPPAPYSSLGFNEPDTLPNLVQVGTTHDFTYQIKSKEHQNTTYNLTTTYELYRLYDVTEGLHSCLSPYRRKIYVGWTNETNLTHIAKEKETIIPDMTILPNRENPINWTDQHTLRFDQGKSSGDGTFIIYYQNLRTNKTMYELRIETTTGDVYFNNEWKGNITLRRQNDKGIIRYKNNILTYTFNNKEIFKEKIYLEKEGQFGFETRDVLMSIGGLKLQHIDEIDVPDKENIWDYVIDHNKMYRIQGNLKKLVYTTEEYYRKYRDINENFTQPTIHTVMDYLDQNLTITSKPHFWLITPNENKSKMPWQETIINITFPRPLTNESFTLLLGNKTGIRITSKQVELITLTNVQTAPYYYNENKTEFHLTILANYTYLQVQVQEKTLETITENFYNETISTYQENTFNTINQIKITQNKPLCFVKEPYDYCFMILAPPKRKTIKPKPSTTNYLTHPPETKQEHEIIIETLPTKKATFDGKLARISNQTNYSLETNFIYLDGEGIIKIGLEEENKTLFTATLNLKEKTIIYKNEQQTIQKKINLTTLKKWIPFKIDIKNNNLTIHVNRSKIFTTLLPKIEENNTRYFTYETINSHFEIRQLILQKNQKRTNLPLLEDPCRLRLIYKELLREETFTLEPETNKTLTNTFTLNKFFDYGKISVNVYGGSNMNNTALHTHFWLVRE